MTMIKMISIAAEMIKNGKSNSEIRKVLFNTKGAKLVQIRKVMELVA